MLRKYVYDLSRTHHHKRLALRYTIESHIQFPQTNDRANTRCSKMWRELGVYLHRTRWCSNRMHMMQELLIVSFVLWTKRDLWMKAAGLLVLSLHIDIMLVWF